MALSTLTQRAGPVAWIGQPRGRAGPGWKLPLLPSRLAAAGQQGWALMGAAVVGVEELGSRQVSPCLFRQMLGKRPYRLGYRLFDVPQTCCFMHRVQKTEPYCTLRLRSQRPRQYT